MKILIGCEESQAVCIEFRKLGFEAFSCDILPCSGSHPEWHLQMDVFKAIMLFRWDAAIFFPPCTDLAVSGAAWFQNKRESGEQRKSIEFFMKLATCCIPKIAIENPVGIISGKYITKYFPDLCKKYGLPIKPSQIIEPYYFGDNANKKTCLWIKGLPLLIHEEHVAGSIYKTAPSGRKYPEWCWNTGGGCGKIRSKTFPGIARNMAEQWGEYLKEKRL